MPPEQLAERAAPGDADDSHLVVAPHLAEAVQLFADMRTQWLTVPLERKGFAYLAMDYRAIRDTAWLGGLQIPEDPARRRRFFEYLKVMQEAGKGLMNR